MHIPAHDNGFTLIFLLMELCYLSAHPYRVLCALVNSLVPGTFTAEVLLSDRYYYQLVCVCAVVHGSCVKLVSAFVLRSTLNPI